MELSVWNCAVCKETTREFTLNTQVCHLLFELFRPFFQSWLSRTCGSRKYLARQLPHISSPKVCKDVGDYSWNPQVSHLPCELCRPPYRVWKAICRSRLLTVCEETSGWLRFECTTTPACSPSSAVMPAGCFCYVKVPGPNALCVSEYLTFSNLYRAVYILILSMIWQLDSSSLLTYYSIAFILLTLFKLLIAVNDHNDGFKSLVILWLWYYKHLS